MGKEVVENGATPSTETEKKEVSAPLPPLQLLQSCLSILEKAVHMKDVRLITGRLLRQTAAVRQRLSKDIITTFANSALPDSAQLKGSIVASLSQVNPRTTPESWQLAAAACYTNLSNFMQVGGEMETDAAQEGPAHSITTCSLPEAEAYAVLLAITYLTDQKQYQEVSFCIQLSCPSMPEATLHPNNNLAQLQLLGSSQVLSRPAIAGTEADGAPVSRQPSFQHRPWNGWTA